MSGRSIVELKNKQQSLSPRSPTRQSDASVDVTGARNARDEQFGEIVAGRVTRTQRRCGDSTGNLATFHSGMVARRQDSGLGVR